MIKIIYFRIPFIILGITVLFLCLSCSEEKDHTTIHPHYGAIQTSFTELAKTQLNKTYDINMPLTGKLMRIHLEPGDCVKKGQIVASLIQTPWQEEVNKARARIATMFALYLNQKKLFNRQTVLAKRGFETLATLDDTRSKIQALDAQIKESEAALQTGLYHLDISVMYSPVDGIVLKRFTQGDQWLAEGAPLLSIGNLKNLEVVSEVLSQQASELKVGDPVLLTNTDHSTSLKGEVKRIDPAGFTKLSALGVEEQRVNVIIRLPSVATVHHMGVEYRLQATFFIGSLQKNALIIPRFSVLQDNQGNFYVFKVVDHHLKKQIIHPDIWTDTQVSISDGLTHTDNIVAEPTAELLDGMTF